MQENKRSMSALGSNKRPKLDGVDSADDLVIPAGLGIELPPDLEAEIQADDVEQNEAAATQDPDEPQDPPLCEAQVRRNNLTIIF